MFSWVGRTLHPPHSDFRASIAVYAHSAAVAPCMFAIYPYFFASIGETVDVSASQITFLFFIAVLMSQGGVAIAFNTTNLSRHISKIQIISAALIIVSFGMLFAWMNGVWQNAYFLFCSFLLGRFGLDLHITCHRSLQFELHSGEGASPSLNAVIDNMLGIGAALGALASALLINRYGFSFSIAGAILVLSLTSAYLILNGRSLRGIDDRIQSTPFAGLETMRWSGDQLVLLLGLCAAFALIHAPVSFVGLLSQGPQETHPFSVGLYWTLRTAISALFPILLVSKLERFRLDPYTMAVFGAALAFASLVSISFFHGSLGAIAFSALLAALGDILLGTYAFVVVLRHAKTSKERISKTSWLNFFSIAIGYGGGVLMGGLVYDSGGTADWVIWWSAICVFSVGAIVISRSIDSDRDVLRGNPFTRWRHPV